MGPLAAGLMLLPATCLARNSNVSSKPPAAKASAGKNSRTNGMKKIPLRAVLKAEKAGRKYIVSSDKNGGTFVVPFKTVPITVRGLVHLYPRGSRGPDNKVLKEDKVYAVVSIHNTKTNVKKPFLIDLSHLSKAYLTLKKKRIRNIRLVVNHEIKPSNSYEEAEILIVPTKKPNGKIEAGMPVTAFGVATTNSRPTYSSRPYVLASR